jgi:putative ATP-dependent endonuclease of the OLD family
VQATSILFKGYRCFTREFVGFEEIKPINVVIGRNNTGKSHLLDFVEALCQQKLRGDGWSYRCKGILTEADLERYFSRSTSHGNLRGNHWQEHGALFVGAELSWEYSGAGFLNLSLRPELMQYIGPEEPVPMERRQRIARALENFTYPLQGRVFRRLFADRDIRPEAAGTTVELGVDGAGATNIIRRFLNSSHPQFPRVIIQRELLDALNAIFGSDGHFTEIEVQEHDEPSSGALRGKWEVYLLELKKGLVPLSASGSGLKTVFLVLLNLLVCPRIQKKQRSEFVFAFEELENNLHPALMRRLLQYIQAYAVRENANVFLTTHSSAALDLFGVSKDAQILHVRHDGEAASVTRIDAHFDKLSVVAELGAKPSDLLQANGIIWVEGPSDCAYINRWLHVYTAGRLREGRDYQCAFYGGALLARAQFQSPEEAVIDLVNLFRINANIVVVCDSDRTEEGAPLKDRVLRIEAEVRKIPTAYLWVTAPRETENYLPGVILAKALEMADLPDPEQHEQFFPLKGATTTSYVEAKLKRRSVDKMELASMCNPHTTLESMKARFDWDAQMRGIVERIDAWNS